MLFRSCPGPSGSFAREHRRRGSLQPRLKHGESLLAGRDNRQAYGRLDQPPTRSAKAKLTGFAGASGRAPRGRAGRVQTSAPAQLIPAPTAQDSAQTEATRIDADLALELIASGVTTQPIETVLAVLAASRDGASINAAAKASGINYRTAQRIVEAAGEHRQRQLVVVG